MTDTHKLNDGPDIHKFGGGNPAFLRQESVLVGDGGWEGMSLRQYAAIKLRVPDSGLLWLDEMIEKSNRDWFAGMALPSVVAAMENNKHRDGLPVELVPDVVAETAYLFADAMLIARGK